MTPFEAFIAPARAHAQLWRVAVTLLLWLSGYSLSLFAVVIGLDSIDPRILDRFYTGKTPIGTLYLLASFILWMIPLLLAIRLMHKRGLRSLLGPHLPKVWRQFIRAAIWGSAIMLLITWISAIGMDLTLNLPIKQWVIYLLPGMVLLMIQISAEELLFRGYLQQQLAVLFNNRLAYLVLPSLVFGALHYTGTYMPAVDLLLVLATAIIGLFLADLTYRTGSLGWALGIHFANNFVAFFTITAQPELGGLALYATPDILSDAQRAIGWLAPQVAGMAILFIIYFIIMERRAARIEFHQANT